MLHIAALFVAGTSGLDDNGAINATQIPMTSYMVAQVPISAQLPIVLIVHARAGGDYDPELYVVCKDPAGVRLASLKGSWHWPDEDDKPSKYRCFTDELSFGVEAEGEYTIGAYYDEAGTIEMATPIPISFTLATPDSA